MIKNIKDRLYVIEQSILVKKGITSILILEYLQDKRYEIQFLGKTDSDLIQRSFDVESLEYRYVQDIDVSNWWADIERKRRMEELRNEMESKFAEIDKKKKFEYYAQIDDDFRELYLEYENRIKMIKDVLFICTI